MVLPSVAPRVVARRLRKSAKVVVLPLDGSGASVSWAGHCRPSSCRRERLTSSTSTSSITSGSTMSCSATMRSATRTASTVSRMMRVFRRSSITRSLVLTMVLMALATALASALARKKLRTTRAWYSFCFCGVAG